MTQSQPDTRGGEIILWSLCGFSDINITADSSGTGVNK